MKSREFIRYFPVFDCQLKVSLSSSVKLWAASAFDVLFQSIGAVIRHQVDSETSSCLSEINQTRTKTIYRKMDTKSSGARSHTFFVTIGTFSENKKMSVESEFFHKLFVNCSSSVRTAFVRRLIISSSSGWQQNLLNIIESTFPYDGSSTATMSQHLAEMHRKTRIDFNLVSWFRWPYFLLVKLW